jgi:hypothetical protein
VRELCVVASQTDICTELVWHPPQLFSTMWHQIFWYVDTNNLKGRSAYISTLMMENVCTFQMLANIYQSRPTHCHIPEHNCHKSLQKDFVLKVNDHHLLNSE